MKFIKGYSKEGQIFRGEAKLPSARPGSDKSSPSSSQTPKVKEMSASEKAKLERSTQKAMTDSYDEAYKDVQKREYEKVKSEKKKINTQSQNGSGWHNESERHSQARMGIKTAEQPQSLPSQTEVSSDSGQVKLANNIQDDMHKLDKLLRQSTNLSDKKKADEKLMEAEKIYYRLSEKMKHHRNTVGELPQWVMQTWQGNEDFGKNGTVKKKITRLLEADEDNYEARQRELFNAVRLPTEPIK